MATQKKIDAVQKLTEKIAKSKSLVFADYVGLKHKQLEELRKKLRAVDAELVVTKNKLMLRAMGDQADSVTSTLTKATATLFNYKDEVSGIKEMLKYFKTANIGKAKAGLLGKTLLTEADVIKLSQLPGREQLLAQLAGQLNAPIQGLHRALSWNISTLVWALHSIQEKKGKQTV